MKILKLLVGITAVIFLYPQTVISQAKKPTLMVVPSDAWCFQNGYMMQFKNQGEVESIPDYERAFRENPDLLLVISKINGLMAERGVPLKNLESSIKSIKRESAENAMLASKGGSEVVESPIDLLRKNAKADIIMQLTWTVNHVGPKRSITFNLQGLDSYTDKQIATAAGTGTPSFSSESPVLLEEAVLAHLDNFSASLQDYFDDLFANGREIIVRIKRFGSWPNDLETEYDGQELGEIIEEWMSANTVKGRFNTTDATENFMLFEQVRIPLYDEKGNGTDARRYMRQLQNFLQAAPYKITNKLMTKGLGEVIIVLGDK